MTEAEKTELIETKIMGWEKHCPRWFLPKSENRDLFTPYERMDHAWMIVDKIVTTSTIDFKSTTKFFSWWNSYALSFVTMTAKQFATAICDGALAALGLLEEE